MRSAVVGLCVVLVCAGPAFAQGTRGGVLVGANVAKLTIDVGGPSFDFDSRTALSTGVFAVVPAGGRFALEPGAFFSMQGAKVNSDEELFGSGTIKLDYVQVPVLARVTVPLGPSAGLRVFAGPSLGILLSAKASGVDETSDTDIKDEVETFDVAAVVGGGVEIRRFIVDVRYMLGLRNLAKDGSDEGATLKNRVLSVMGGIRF